MFTKNITKASKYTSIWKKAVEKNDAKPDENLRKSCSFKENCGGCFYRSLCTKAEYGRMVQRNENWLSHKKKVNEILHTEKYHELMKQRSSNAKQFLDRQNKKIPQVHFALCEKKGCLKFIYLIFPISLFQNLKGLTFQVLLGSLFSRFLATL